jgi:cellulose synthase/poly-beta-1,6-N-acetylglucosamine synthase-like glycosyltransferase
MARVANDVIGLVLAYSCLYYCSVLVFGVVSQKMLRSRRPSTRLAERELAKQGSMPGVTMIMPAYNEEVVIVETVKSALAMNYPNIEVVVVSDGSKDNTIGVLVEAFGLVRHDSPAPGPIETKEIFGVYRSNEVPVVVIDKGPSGAKADGSNCGLNFARHPWVAIMDADELVDPDAVLRCMVDVLHHPGNVVGVGVTLLPTNGADVEQGLVLSAPVSNNYWVGCQLIEYLTGFLMAKPGMSQMGAMPNISGGFGMYRREVLQAIGGYTHGHMGEDMDLVLRVHRYFLDRKEQYNMIQVPEAIVWTEFPQTKAVLRRQRIRWHRGLRQVLQGANEMIARPRYGRFGMVTLPFQFLFEWVAVPLEAIGLILMLGMGLFGKLNWGSTISLALACQGLSLMTTITAVIGSDRYLEQYRNKGDMYRLIKFALLSQVGFRQLTLWWRIRSLFKGSTAWGEMPRIGYAKPAAKPA